MNAQDRWKVNYIALVEDKEIASIKDLVYYRKTMLTIRREAALERIIARLQREKMALAEMVEDANKDVEDLCSMLEKRKNEFDRSISQALNEGDGIYRP